MGKIVFWQNLPSFHQSAMIEELANISARSVTLVTDTDVNSSRRVQGWPTPKHKAAQCVVAPTDGIRKSILKNASSEDDLHVVSGFFAYPGATWALRSVSETNAKIAVIAESGYLHDGWKVPMRRVREYTRAKRWDGALDLILAIGSQGVEWYRNAGYRRTPVVPMIYTVYPNTDVLTYEKPGGLDKTKNLIFVGQFTRRKGIDLLTRALVELREYDWRLCLVGDGPLRDAETGFLAKNGVMDRVEWIGNVSNERALSEIAASDCLVLPSRFDGWGTVVNEALSMGKEVVVSSRCGAADIVASSDAGKVFVQGSWRDLREKLIAMFSDRRVSSIKTESIREWARAHIYPEVVAGYVNDLFDSCISGQIRVGSSPWMKPSRDKKDAI